MGLTGIVASLFAFTIAVNGQGYHSAGIYNQHPGLKINQDGNQVQYSYSADHMIPQAAPKSPETVSFPSQSSYAASQPAYQPSAYQSAAYQQPAYQQPAYQQPAYQQPAYQPTAYKTAPAADFSAPAYQPRPIPKESPIFATAQKLFGDNAAILGPGFVGGHGLGHGGAPASTSYQPYTGGASKPTYHSGAPSVAVAQHNPYQSYGSSATATQGYGAPAGEQQISPQDALRLHNAQLESHQKQVAAQEALILSFTKQLGLDQPQPQAQGQPQQAQYQQYQAPATTQYRPQAQQSYGYSPQYSSQSAPSYKTSYQAK